MKRFKENKRIMLVALVITIIMIILVGVTVAVLIRGDLFNTANNEKTISEDSGKHI